MQKYRGGGGKVILIFFLKQIILAWVRNYQGKE